MADGYQLQLPRLAEVVGAFERGPDIVLDELNRFFAWTMPYLAGEIQDRTPTSQGLLRNSIIGSWQVTPGNMLGVVGTPLNYAPAVELGTKPHAVSESGILAIAEWAKRKLPLGQAVSLKTGRPLKSKGVEEAALSAAHAIAWKIRARGTQGAFMFRDAFDANRLKIIDRFNQTVDRIVQRIGGAA